MLERGHIEFIQPQQLPLKHIGGGLALPDVDYKMLSRNPKHYLGCSRRS